MTGRVKQVYLTVLGVFLTAALALLVYILETPNPMMILIIPIVYFTYVGGWQVGLTSGGVAILYSLYFFSNKGQLFHYNAVNVQKIATILICIVSIITLMGKLKKREQQYIDELDSLNKTLESFAFFDPLTNTFNRHALISHFGQPAVAVAKGLSFAMLDLEHFKSVNDCYGHAVGDQMLKHVVEQFWKVIPSNSHLYRWGGEEFLLIIKTGDKEEVLGELEQIRVCVQENALLNDGEHINVTVSIGCVVASENATIHDCIVLADQCLYAAKYGGRNRVVSNWQSDVLPPGGSPHYSR